MAISKKTRTPSDPKWTRKRAESAAEFHLSIIIPVYQGEGSIQRVVRHAVQTLASSFKLDVVLVNDASPDGSQRVCAELVREYPGQVRLIDLAVNSGEHNAVLAGLRHCRGDLALIMDDDDQNAPEDVHTMWQAMREHDWDVTFGDYRQKQHAWWRNVGSRFNDLVATWMLGKPKDLYLCSFKLMNRFTIQEVLKYQGPFPYLDGLVLRSTRHVGSVPVTHRPRKEGSSSYTLTKLFRLWMAMFTNFSILPLRIASVAGFLLAGLALTGAAAMVAERILGGGDVPGWTSLFVGIIFFAGVQLASLGLIGEYLGRTFLTMNGTPAYTVRRILE